jgi:ribosomal protein S18 acetylase RimI-like enzyme
MQAEQPAWDLPSTALWAIRPLGPADDSFLDELYESTRLDEVLTWGLEPAQARAFLASQASIQRRAYALQFPAAEHWALLREGRPVGRLIVHIESDALRVVDVSVLPAERGKGLASWALGELLRRAERLAPLVRLQVTPENPARRLYERLGFRVASDDGQRLSMEWRTG